MYQLSPPKSAPLWMGITVLVCFVIFLVISLTVDLNGNVIFTNRSAIPDILNPAPKLLMLITLACDILIALARAVLYRPRRYVWVTLSAFFIILMVVVILPSL